MRVLIVEDEIKIWALLKKRLEEACFVVDISENGKEGSFLARTTDYDVIILDNQLPEKNGLDICKEVRAIGKTTPILMLSVRSEIQTKVELLNVGADDYLSKPFSFEELLARLHALLRRPKQIQKDIIILDDLQLDCRKHMVMRKGRVFYLSRKEFMLLEYLLKNRGVVLTRGMIMEHVWDMNADPFSNTIEAHILSLRKKIETNGKKRIIHTIPGRGYMIE